MQVTVKIDCPIHGHVEILTENPVVVYDKVRCPFPHCESKISDVNIWLGGIKVATWELNGKPK